MIEIRFMTEIMFAAALLQAVLVDSPAPFDTFAEVQTQSAGCRGCSSGRLRHRTARW